MDEQNQLPPWALRVSSVAEKMLPEINKTTEIIYFKDWTQLKVATSS